MYIIFFFYNKEGVFKKYLSRAYALKDEVAHNQA